MVRDEMQFPTVLLLDYTEPACLNSKKATKITYSLLILYYAIFESSLQIA